MAGSLVASKQTVHRRTKVKTGCATCRIRRVKCDENKPSCQRCVGTGRTCDGYESPFRLFASQPPPINDAHAGGIKSGASSHRIRPTSTEITPEDIDLLSRCFSTKTIFDVNIGCDDEARHVLQASLTDPPIRHAVLSLRALREHLETSGNLSPSVAQQTPGYDYGLQEYCMALGGLASNLSCPGSDGLKSALLCCQIFVSIEQVRGNYAAMAQHIVRGLGIMHQYRARPSLHATNELLPAHDVQLPFVDVFLIKLFAAPCKFAELPARTDTNEMTMSACPMSTQQQPGESRQLRSIAPDMRTELTRIASSTLEFLEKVSRVTSAGSALQLLSDKASLLDSLGSWLADLELVHKKMNPAGSEPLSVSFMRLFYQILIIVLLGALDSSADLDAELRTENGRLQDVASIVGERVQAYYKMCGGT
ncbi:Uu.00g013290.m01.CDS01 [Anthostomella pinea]|uniref:Uu.00g013290.m01.CDS01 n=1 Tax=Anthostomella pinea TaxID=933095 RepID=A0AAI8VYQ1_9PEZI|nr:Uu.00g013290.m01.CDS01 [Anthostomella pinea]